jgi:hypothetical protein
MRRYCPGVTLGEWVTEGNAPAYLTAVIASVAAIFAYRSSHASRRSAEAAATQLKHLETDRASEQAGTVAVWNTAHAALNYYDMTDGAPTSIPYLDAYNLRYRVQNASSLAIYDVSIYLEADALYFVGHMHQFPPNLDGPKAFATSVVAKGLSSPRLGVLFVDAQSRYWDRLPSGRLELLTEQEHIRKLAVVMENSARLRDEIPLVSKDKSSLFRVSRL